MALVANGSDLLGLDPFYQQVTLGVILLLAVGRRLVETIRVTRAAVHPIAVP